MVVKPKGLAPVDKELWVMQSEFYLGKPGEPADMNKLNAEKPDVIAFNGYANQYKANPITVKKGERIRMYVLNAGPTKWSAFHVIGTVFDKAIVENTAFHSSQTMNLAPSQGGWAEFTLDHEGNYPFVDHAFGDMVKGAAGILHTSNAKAPAGAEAAPAPADHSAMGHGSAKAAASGDTVDVTLGEMFIKTNTPTIKAGKVTFNIKNTGAAMHAFAVGADPLKMKGGASTVVVSVMFVLGLTVARASRLAVVAWARTADVGDRQRARPRPWIPTRRAALSRARQPARAVAPVWMCTRVMYASV
jgi:uncharacterized cupredoxin-like copper-binding protein